VSLPPKKAVTRRKAAPTTPARTKLPLKKAAAAKKAGRPPLRDADAVVFGTKLREAREAAGLSQAELAKLVKIPQPRLPGLEQGRTDVRLSTIRRLAEALGIPLTDLLPPH
jgi:ribosome-binding protein aMBF1 (putative translation factor)